MPARLDNANGVGYLPQGYNGHGLAGTTVGPTANGCTPSPTNVCPNPSDQGGGFPSMAQLMTLTTATCMEDLLTALGNGNDARENFLPSVNPQITGGYQWMISCLDACMATWRPSIRTGATNATCSEIVSTANPRYVDPKKLWVAAMKPTPTPGTDPSYPAFYLEGQELYAGNSRGYWVLPQCIAPSATLLGGDPLHLEPGLLHHHARVLLRARYPHYVQSPDEPLRPEHVQCVQGRRRNMQRRRRLLRPGFGGNTLRERRLHGAAA